MLTASWLVDMIKMHTAKYRHPHWVKMVPWKRTELLFGSSRALQVTGRKKQLYLVTLAAVPYYTKHRMVQALKKCKSIARGLIHSCVQGHASALPQQWLGSVCILSFPAASKPCKCIQTQRNSDLLVDSWPIFYEWKYAPRWNFRSPNPGQHF